MAPDAAKREASGTLVRGMIAELRARGLFDGVRARVSAEAKAMMDDPPLFIAWVPGQAYEELTVQVGQLAGRDAVRALGYANTRNAAGPLITPLVKTYYRWFGGSPVAVLKNLGKVAHVQYRGVGFEYEPETERSGFVTLRHAEPVSDFVYAAWEGAFELGKDLTGDPTFTVGKSEILEGGKAGRVRLQW